MNFYYFLRPHRTPPVTRILLVESGSRHLMEKLIPNLKAVYGEALEIDLCTCFPGRPEALTHEAKIYRTGEFGSNAARRELYRRLRENRYQAVGIVCSAERIMTKWKWMLAHQVPSHVFLINENADFVWLDRKHAAGLFVYARTRLGFEGAGAVRTMARFVLFPLSVAYLLFYAGAVHTRRLLRKMAA